ncbi:MAG: hypothetical protein DWQ20_07045 [Actinobacteria bacterium]|nr:MAG: hypothetical protein DWQ20_07045 [Actinomycetota bacterium]
MGGNAPDKDFWERERKPDGDLLDGRVRRRIANQMRVLNAIQDDPKITSVAEAAKAAGVAEVTVQKWNREDPDFAKQYKKAKQFLQNRRKALARARDTDVVKLDHEEVERLPFAEWRRHYTGRGTPRHHQALVDAFEDKTNKRIFMLGPPGMGKDTSALDIVARETCYDQGLRVAWIMESERFAGRRIEERLDPYLTDPKTYRTAPLGSTSQVPTGSLIEDFGPFKWASGMVDTDGNSVRKTTWTKNEKYFIRGTTDEAEPNLWATGLGGALYGARVDLMVISDAFTRENQTSPTVMEDQFQFILGTARSRLDTRGRMVFLGTRIKKGDNYERLMQQYIGEAPVVKQEGWYTKYANGTATVIIPPIVYNEDGEMESYWPEEFPLRSYFQMPPEKGEKIGKRIEIGNLTIAEQDELAEQGAERVDGLLDIKEDLKGTDIWASSYEQNPPEDMTGDFNDAVLEKALDETRTYGVWNPSEVTFVGADPARVGGAAWTAMAVDRSMGTMTVIDWFFGERLGIQGIKSKLILWPLERFRPLWYAYEVNKESAVLDDSIIKEAFTDFATSLYRHQTHAGNRSRGHLSVSAMSFLMRSGVLRLPAMTAEDRKKSERLFEFFKNFDARSHAEGRSRPGQKGHQPDDPALATWVCSIKAYDFLEGASGAKVDVRSPVPQSVRKKWERMRRRQIAERTGEDQYPLRHEQPKMTDVALLLASGEQ